MQKEKKKNIVCTWDEDSDCETCSIKSLRCKWEGKYLTAFILLFLPFGISAFFGLSMTGIITKNWYFLIGYILFLVIFFQIIELRVLCRHCPFYSEDTKILHCSANHGLIKTWKYTLEPLGKGEKVILIFCFILFGAVPIISEVYTILFIQNNLLFYGEIDFLLMIGILLSTIITIITFFGVLIIFYCPSCLNFSCPFNRVPKNTVNEYLKRNPAMREAWEKKGYRIDG